MIYTIIRNLFFCFLKLFYRLEISGRENIPTTGGVILVSNHVSNWDPPALGSASNRQVHFLAKEELFKVPVLNFFMPAFGAIPLKRGRGDREAITKSLKILAAGKVLGIFIEGTRNHNKSKHLGKAQPGTAMLAHKSKAPVVPVLLLNTDAIGRSLKKVRAIIGPPVKLDYDPNLEKKELYNELSRQIIAAIEGLRPSDN